jgi:hypothetical protein
MLYIKDKIQYLGENEINIGSINSENDIINIIIYNINNENMKPYLEFILEKNNNKYEFIKYKWINYKTPYIILDNLKNEINSNITYKGFYKYKKQLFLFYNIFNINNINNINNNFLLFSPFEIININYNIFHIDVYNFFLINKLFNYLSYEKKIIETPYVIYHNNDNLLSYLNDFKLHNNFYKLKIKHINRFMNKKYYIFLGLSSFNIKPHKSNFNSFIYKKNLYIKNFNQIIIPYIYS